MIVNRIEREIFTGKLIIIGINNYRKQASKSWKYKAEGPSRKK